MKKTIFALMCAGFMLTVAGVSASAQDTKTVKFNVSMTCENCVEKITENISYEKGVKDLNVSLENKTVEVTYDPSKTDENTLNEAITKLGYTVSAAPSEARTMMKDDNIKPITDEKPEKVEKTDKTVRVKKAEEDVADTGETVGEKIKETANKVGDKTVETANKVGDKTVETADKVGDKTKETAETVGEKTKETANTVGDKTKETANKVGDKTKETANKVGDFFKKDKTE